MSSYLYFVRYWAPCVENYKKARYEVKKLIAEKRKNYFETKPTENNGKPKGLWKTLKALG